MPNDMIFSSYEYDHTLTGKNIDCIQGWTTDQAGTIEISLKWS